MNTKVFGPSFARAQVVSFGASQNLRARSGRGGRFLTLNIPASILNTGEYELTLKGISGKEKVEDLGYYYFDVLKK